LLLLNHHYCDAIALGGGSYAGLQEVSSRKVRMDFILPPIEII
jgi:hypothetical protein